MIIPVSFFLALAVAVFAYSQNQGGPIAGLLFFGVLFIGGFIHVAKPMFGMVNSALPEKYRR